MTRSELKLAMKKLEFLTIATQELLSRTDITTTTTTERKYNAN